MNKVLNIAFYVVAGIVIIAVFMGYTYITAKGSPQTINPIVLDDKSYLSANQDRYADCYYTVEVGDLNIPTITNKYFNQGVNADKLESLEDEFENKYKRQCQPVLQEYASRYSQYEKHQQEAAEAELSQLDKWLGKKPEVIFEPSPNFSLYQKFDPKSLQYPTNTNAKRLYTKQDYEAFVIKNL